MQVLTCHKQNVFPTANKESTIDDLCEVNIVTQAVIDLQWLAISAEFDDIVVVVGYIDIPIGISCHPLGMREVIVLDCS